MSYQSYTYSSSTQPLQKNFSSSSLYPSAYNPTKFPTYTVDGSFPYHAVNTMASSSYTHDKPSIIVTASSPKQTHHSARAHDSLSFYPTGSSHVGSKPSAPNYDPNYLSPTYIKRNDSSSEKPKSSLFGASPPKKIEQNGATFKYTTPAVNHIDVGPYDPHSSANLARKNHSVSQPLFSNYIPTANPATNNERHKKLIFETTLPSDKAPKTDRAQHDAGWKTGLIDHTFSPPKNPHISNHTSHGHESHTKSSYQAPSYEAGHNADAGRTREFNFEVSKPKTEYTTKSLITRFIDSDDLLPSARDSYEKPVKSIKDAQKVPQFSTETYRQTTGAKEFSPELYRPQTTQASTSSTIGFAHYHDLLSSVKEPEPTGLQDRVPEKHIETHKQAGFGPHLGSSVRFSTSGGSPHTFTNEFSYEHSRPQTTQAAKSTSIFGHSDHFAPPARESVNIFSLKEKSPEVPKQSGFGLPYHTHTSMRTYSPERTKEIAYERQKPQVERVAKSPMRFIDSDDLLPSARATYQKPAVTKVKSKKNTFDNQGYYENQASFMHHEGAKRSSVPYHPITTSQTSHSHPSHNVEPYVERHRAMIFNVDRSTGAGSNKLTRVNVDNDPSRNLVSVPPKIDYTSYQIPLTTSTSTHIINHGAYGTHGLTNDLEYDYHRPTTGMTPAVRTSTGYKSSAPYSHGVDHFSIALDKLDKHAGLSNVKNPSSYDSPRRGDYGYLNLNYGGAETSRY